MHARTYGSRTPDAARGSFRLTASVIIRLGIGVYGNLTCEKVG